MSTDLNFTLNDMLNTMADKIMLSAINISDNYRNIPDKYKVSSEILETIFTGEANGEPENYIKNNLTNVKQTLKINVHISKAKYITKCKIYKKLSNPIKKIDSKEDIISLFKKQHIDDLNQNITSQNFMAAVYSIFTFYINHVKLCVINQSNKLVFVSELDKNSITPVQFQNLMKTQLIKYDTSIEWMQNILFILDKSIPVYILKYTYSTK